MLIPLTLAADPLIDNSFSIDLSALSYPQFTADTQGNFIVSGFVRKCDLPAVHPLSSCGPLWIGKFDPSGQSLLFATYLGDNVKSIGGFSSPASFNLRTDPNDNIIMVDSVTKAELPTVNAIQTDIRGNSNLYIFKLASDGSSLIYATYLGGNNNEVPASLAVDSKGAAYILDTTNSGNFPTTPQTVQSSVYGRSAIVKLAPDGSLEYSATIPWVYTSQPIIVDASGAVSIVAAPTSVITLSRDATSIETSPIPSLPNSTAYPFISGTSDGGLWISGSASDANLPITENALQSITGPSPYLRIENGTQPFPRASLLTQ